MIQLLRQYDEDKTKDGFIPTIKMLADELEEMIIEPEPEIAEEPEDFTGATYIEGTNSER